MTASSGSVFLRRTDFISADRCGVGLDNITWEGP